MANRIKFCPFCGCSNILKEQLSICFEESRYKCSKCKKYFGITLYIPGDHKNEKVIQKVEGSELVSINAACVLRKPVGILVKRACKGRAKGNKLV